MKLDLIEKCNFYRNLVNQKYQDAVKNLSSAGLDLSSNPKKLELAEKLKLLHDIKSRYPNQPNSKDFAKKHIKTES